MILKHPFKQGDRVYTEKLINDLERGRPVNQKVYLTVIKQYPTYVLCQSDCGYKTCVMNADLLNQERSE